MLTPDYVELLKQQIQYNAPMIDNHHRHSLWYGGDVATLTYNGKTYTLCANGDVELSLLESEKDDVHEVTCIKDRSNHGIFGERMRHYLSGDEDLHPLLCGESVKNRTLDITDTNWWEIFVTDGIQTTSFCCDSDAYDDAVNELLDLVQRDASPYGEINFPNKYTVFVYHETCDDAAFGAMITRVFKKRDGARSYLRSRVEDYFNKPWPQCRELVLHPDPDEDDNDAPTANTFTTDYVSYGPTGDGYYFWAIEEHEVL